MSLAVVSQKSETFQVVSEGAARTSCKKKETRNLGQSALMQDRASSAGGAAGVQTTRSIECSRGVQPAHHRCNHSTCPRISGKQAKTKKNMGTHNFAPAKRPSFVNVRGVLLPATPMAVPSGKRGKSPTLWKRWGALLGSPWLELHTLRCPTRRSVPANATSSRTRVRDDRTGQICQRDPQCSPARSSRRVSLGAVRGRLRLLALVRPAPGAQAVCSALRT